MPPRPRPALSPPQVQLDQAKNDITQRQAQPDDARLKSTAVEKQLIDAKSGAAQLLLGNWICGGGYSAGSAVFILGSESSRGHECRLLGPPTLPSAD
jgi:hypothetical protein